MSQNEPSSGTFAPDLPHREEGDVECEIRSCPRPAETVLRMLGRLRIRCGQHANELHRQGAEITDLDPAEGFAQALLQPKPAPRAFFPDPLPPTPPASPTLSAPPEDSMPPTPKPCRWPGCTALTTKKLFCARDDYRARTLLGTAVIPEEADFASLQRLWDEHTPGTKAPKATSVTGVTLTPVGKTPTSKGKTPKGKTPPMGGTEKIARAKERIARAAKPKGADPVEAPPSHPSALDGVPAVPPPTLEGFSATPGPTPEGLSGAPATPDLAPAPDPVLTQALAQIEDLTAQIHQLKATLGDTAVARDCWKAVSAARANVIRAIRQAFLTEDDLNTASNLAAEKAEGRTVSDEIRVVEASEWVIAKISEIAKEYRLLQREHAEVTDILGLSGYPAGDPVIPEGVRVSGEAKPQNGGRDIEIAREALHGLSRVAGVQDHSAFRILRILFPAPSMEDM